MPALHHQGLHQTLCANPVSLYSSSLKLRLRPLPDKCLFNSPEVLVLYLKRPRAKSGELRRCGGALQIQRLEGSRPAGLWDLYLDGTVLIVCEFAVAVRALGFQERVAERTGVGKRIRESESHHHTAF